MTNITRDQAEDLLHDLIFAYDDSCTFPKKPSYHEDYINQRERIIEALLFGILPGAGSKADDTEAVLDGDTDGGRTVGSNPATGATIEPRFSTRWEQEDYEREKRGEKPLGPPFFQCPDCGEDIANSGWPHTCAPGGIECEPDPNRKEKP